PGERPPVLHAGFQPKQSFQPAGNHKTHVYFGEIELLTDGKARLTGAHHWPAAKRSPIPMARTRMTAAAPNGWWSAYLVPRTGEPGTVQFDEKFSTFFPDHLTPTQIRSSAEQAYLDAVKHWPTDQTRFDLTTGKWWGRDKHGNGVLGHLNAG